MSDQMNTGITSDDKLWALLAYLITPLVPIIILLMDDKKKRPFIKAHTVQALIWGIIGIVLAFTFIIPFLILIGQIYFGIKAYQGEYINIPVITDFVKKQGWA